LTASLSPAAMVISWGRVGTMTRLVMHLIEVKTSKVKGIEVLDEERLLVEVVEG
jgi:predicted DNA-binding WGR domain protein